MVTLEAVRLVNRTEERAYQRRHGRKAGVCSPMLVADVKALAKEWVEKEAVGCMISGCLFHGFVTELPTAPLIRQFRRIFIVLHGSETMLLWLFSYHDLLFEVTYVAG